MTTDLIVRVHDGDDSLIRPLGDSDGFNAVISNSLMIKFESLRSLCRDVDDDGDDGGDTTSFAELDCLPLLDDDDE